MKTNALVLLVLMCGCTPGHKILDTEFEPYGDGTFRFRAIGGLSDSHEAIRLGWLSDYLHDNNMCPAGFVITERKPVVANKSIFGQIGYRIIYYGRCAPKTSP